MTDKGLHVKITGKVQGVSFRYHTRKKADELDLRGWVKNCQDGSVEALIFGNEKNLTRMIEWFKKGSPYAVVQSVLTEAADPPATIGQFRITY